MVTKWFRRLALVLGIAGVLWFAAPSSAQGPFAAQIQAAILALLRGNQTISGNWTCTGTCTGFGGTGGLLPSSVQGDLYFATGTNTPSVLHKNTTATRYLSNTGTSNNPAWAQVDLATGVTGNLPSANLPTSGVTGDVIIGVTTCHFVNGLFTGCS